MSKVKQLVGFVLDEMAKLPKDSSDVHVFIRTESQQAFKKLTDLLLMLKDCQDEVSPSNMASLIAFLHARWRLIQHSPASPFSFLDSRINKACLKLAKEISDHLNLPVNQILMPGIEVKSPQKLSEAAEEFFKLHVLLSDLQVVYLPAMMLAFQKNRRWQMDGKILTDDDINRIVNHSTFTQEFFHIPDQSKAVVLKLEAIVASLKLATKEYNFTGYSKDYLHVCFLSEAFSIDSLTNKMCLSIPRNEWRELLDAIDESSLISLMIKGNFLSFGNGLPETLREFNEELTEKNHALPELLDRLNISEEKKELKVAAFCALLLRAAYIIRQQNPWEYYSAAGRVLSYFPSMTGVYSKTEKLEAISAMMDFFTGDNHLISYESHQNTQMQAYAGALAFGETALIKNQLKSLAKYFMPEVEGPAASLGM